jgi:hypothetical protein
MSRHTRIKKVRFAHGTPNGVHPSLAIVIYKHATPPE